MYSIDLVMLSVNWRFLCLFRFDECGLSPLTVKALTTAGYVQMTRVQEATLSLALEGVLLVAYVLSSILQIINSFLKMSTTL